MTRGEMKSNNPTQLRLASQLYRKIQRQNLAGSLGRFQAILDLDLAEGVP